MQKSHDRLPRMGAIAGIIAPVLFVGIFTIEGLLRSGYSPIGTYISALSLNSRGVIQIANFMVFGMLLLFFASVLAAAFKNSKVSQSGPTLITIFAVILSLSGPFVMDIMNALPSQVTLHGRIHAILGGIAFLLMPISCFVFRPNFLRDQAWISFAPWTFLISLVLSAALAVFIFATKFPVGQRIFHDFFGLIQRIVLVPYMMWLFTFALAFHKRL